MTAPRNPKRARKKEQRRAKIEQEIRAYNARRRRRLTINLALLAVVVGGIAFVVINANSKKTPDAAASPSPSASSKVKAGGVACKGKVPPKATSDSPSTPPPNTLDKAKTYTAVMETSCGTVEIKLAQETSPNVVNAFVFLSRQGFYDGLIFHRLVKGFALQGGDPKGDGTGGPNFKIADAPPKDFKYVKGVVAMAKGGAEPAGTSGSQFFIVPGDGAATLPADYAVLGTVVGGEDVVAKINAVPTGRSPGGGEESKPLQTVYIIKVTIRES